MLYKSFMSSKSGDGFLFLLFLPNLHCQGIRPHCSSFISLSPDQRPGQLPQLWKTCSLTAIAPTLTTDSVSLSNTHFSWGLRILFSLLTLKSLKNSSCYAVACFYFFSFLFLLCYYISGAKRTVSSLPGPLNTWPALSRIILCVKYDVLKQPAQPQQTLTLWSAESLTGDYKLCM